MLTLSAEELPVASPLRDDLLIEGDAATAIARLPDETFELIYIDPPWGRGGGQRRRTTRARPDESGAEGFGGRRYARPVVAELAYEDVSEEGYVEFLRPLLHRARELLTMQGTLYVHLDYRCAHYVKVELDGIFGRECFLNELIWAYDFGAKPRRRWPAKHDTILVYVRDRERYWFDAEAVEREPYMAPGLAGPEKAARGKLPTSVWWHTIVPTNGAEKTGYPSQKPAGVVRRIVTASSRPGAWCLDFFCGSGTLGAVCAELGRRFVLVDRNPEAIAIAGRRLEPEEMR
jgi:site-specific DNA-methyltransferase (adenine-specific)